MNLYGIIFTGGVAVVEAKNTADAIAKLAGEDDIQESDILQVEVIHPSEGPAIFWTT